MPGARHLGHPAIVRAWRFAAIDFGETVARLRAREGQEWPYFVFVCGAKSIDIVAPRIFNSNDVCASPGKHRHVLVSCQDVCHESPVATVAIGKSRGGVLFATPM